MKFIRMLIIEDDVDDAFLIGQVFRRAGYSLDTQRVETKATTEKALGQTWDAIVCDYRLPGFPWPGALDLARELQPATPFVVVSGAIDDDRGAAAIRAGASDYLDKRDLVQLPEKVERAIRLRRAEALYRQHAEAVIHATGPLGSAGRQFLK